MTSERIYRIKQSPFKVMEMILHDDFGKFDLTIVKTLLAGLTNFSIGSRVKLNNGSIAEIIFVDTNSPTRPLVKMINSHEIINLSKMRDLYIRKFFNLGFFVHNLSSILIGLRLFHFLAVYLAV